jgi:hypothetical protein
MGIADRPATCTSCGKRLTRKQWFYRNGKYFCKRRCWEKETAKIAAEAAKLEKEAPAEPAAPAKEASASA